MEGVLGGLNLENSIPLVQGATTPLPQIVLVWAIRGSQQFCFTFRSAVLQASAPMLAHVELKQMVQASSLQMPPWSLHLESVCR